MVRKNTRIFLIGFVVSIILLIALISSMSFIVQKVIISQQNTRSAPISKPLTSVPQIKIELKVNGFEQAVKNRDAIEVINMFSDATSIKQKQAFDSLSGKDMGNKPRLFNTVSSNINLASWKILNVKPEKSDQKYIVTIEEMRSYENPAQGGYTTPAPTSTVLEMIKINGDWKVDKYYLINGPNLTQKYGGLGF